MSGAAHTEEHHSYPEWSFREMKQFAYLLLLEQNGSANRVAKWVLTGDEHEAIKALHRYYTAAKKKLTDDVAKQL